MAVDIGPGIGTTVSWDGTALGNLEAWSGPRYSRDLIETTHLGVTTTNHFRTYKKGISDAPEMDFTIQFDAGDAGLVKLMAELISDVWSDEKVLLLTLNDGTGSDTIWTADAIITSADWSGQEIDGKVMVEMTAKYVGKAAYTAGA